MLHQTSIPWSPARMRRLIFSLICFSGNAANVLKPPNVGISSSQIRIAFDGRIASPWLFCEPSPDSAMRAYHLSRRLTQWSYRPRAFEAREPEIGEAEKEGHSPQAGGNSRDVRQ